MDREERVFVCNRLIDAHVHLDTYEVGNQTELLQTLEESSVDYLIAVSTDRDSAYRHLQLAEQDCRVKPAIGYHPEQALPSDKELLAILQLLEERNNEWIAIGEVGLPYYLRQDHPELCVQSYIDVLELFIKKAAQYDLPIVLHAVYEDVEIACDLLEKHNIIHAHFHWFKGSDAVLERIITNGYRVSVTPDVMYKKKIQHLVKQTPLSQLMVETDGPWPFEGEFSGKVTHPSMMHKSVQMIAKLKGMELSETYRQLYETTMNFYRLPRNS